MNTLAASFLKQIILLAGLAAFRLLVYTDGALLEMQLCKLCHKDYMSGIHMTFRGRGGEVRCVHETSDSL